MAAKVGLGDPVYRAAVAEHRRTLPPSESGRYCVVVDDGDGELLAVYGPFGVEKALDAAGSLTSDHAEKVEAFELAFRIAPWVDETPA
jgi:hypothetical protein